MKSSALFILESRRPKSRMDKALKSKSSTNTSKLTKERFVKSDFSGSEAERRTHDRSVSPESVKRPKSRAGRISKDLLDSDDDDYDKKKSDSESVSSHKIGKNL